MYRTVIPALALCIASFTAAHTAHAGEPAPSYGQELAQVYGTYQAVLARKEVCHDASPNTRGANEKAYAAWRARNGKTIAELDDRLARMIRGVSKDEKEYARNIGKYEGAMLEQRHEAKIALLAQPPGELQALCKGLPQLLSDKDNDLEMLYAEELKSIRSRR